MDLQNKIRKLHNDGLSDRKIAKLCNISKSNVGYRLTRYKGLSRWVELDNIQKQLLYGSLLGDAHLRQDPLRGGKTPQYTIEFIHGTPQYNYLKLKYKILQSKRKIKEILPSETGFSCQSSYKFVYKHAPTLKLLASVSLTNLKKYVTREWLNLLDPIGLAFWFQDDGHSIMGGSRNKKGFHTTPTVRISTCAFSDIEMDVIRNYFLDKWNIKTKILKSNGYNFLVITYNNARRFIDIISPWVFLSYKIKFNNKEIGRKLKIYLNDVESVPGQCPQNHILDTDTSSPPQTQL